MKKILILSFTLSLILILNSCNNQGEQADQLYQIPEEIKALPVGTTLGLRAPEIELPDQNGAMMKLSDLQGKVVLLDFWASWCNPCRNENPHLVKVYNAYNNMTFTKGKGFEIVSVSLDRNEQAWKEAIVKDKLSWSYMLGDMQGARTQAAQDYGVQVIPTNFLLDQNGVIIAMNLRGDALGDKLESLIED